jgi:hypothetical protein
MANFDNSKTGVKAIVAANNQLGYKVKSYELKTTPIPTASLNKTPWSCSKGSGKSCCEKAK